MNHFLGGELFMKLLVTTGILVSLLSVPAFADKISIRADSWCPFNCAPGDKDKGFMLEIAEFSLAKKGHTIDYQTMPWPRALAEAKDGKIDAVVGAAEPDVRDAKLVVGKESLGITNNCMFAKDSSTAKFSGPADIKNFKKIGVVQDYSYGDDLDGALKATKGVLEPIGGDNPQELNIRKLEADRIDAVLEDSAVMGYVMKKVGTKGIKKLGCEPKSGPVYIGFSAKSPKGAEYSKLLDDGVQELRKSGKLKEIMAKYGLSDWK
jgi:polar amino acid transport system substrate-binding protein